MVKEPDAGGDVILASAVKIEAGADARLASRTVDGCLAHGSPIACRSVYTGWAVENKAQPAYCLKIAAHLLRLQPPGCFKLAAHGASLGGMLLLLLRRTLRLFAWKTVQHLLFDKHYFP